MAAGEQFAANSAVHSIIVGNEVYSFRFWPPFFP